MPLIATFFGALSGVALVIGFGVVSAVAAVGMLASEGGNVMDEQALTDIVTRFPLVAGSVLLTGVALVGTALLAARLSKTSIKEAIGFRSAPPIAFLLAPIGIVALGPTSDLAVTFMAEHFPNWTFGALDQLQKITEGHPYWMLWPFIALCPGFAEEVFFRGMIQRSFGFTKRAIVISAVGFAVFHMDPHHVAGVLPLGFYLAWLGHRTGSLWVPVFAHVGNNSFALLGSQIDAEALDVGHGTDTPMPFWWAPIGWAICAVVVAVIWYATRDQLRWRGPAGRPDAGEFILNPTQPVAGVASPASENL